MGPAVLPRRDDDARAHLEQVGSSARPLVLARDRAFDLAGGLAGLVPGGVLTRGVVVRVSGEAVGGPAPCLNGGPVPCLNGRGATSVGCSLAAAVTGVGEWAAAVELDGSLGALAAAEAGVALERFAVVRRVPPARWATVVAALLEGVSLVLADVPRGVALGDARRLIARAREREAVLVVVEHDGRWPAEAALTLRATGGAWDLAAGHLAPRAVHLVVEGRGAAARPVAGELARAVSRVLASVDQHRDGEVTPVRSGAARSRRVCTVWCPDWPIVAARVRDPSLVDAPIAVVERGERATVVRAVSIEARREGVTRGLRRREAEARCAGLAVIDADDSSDARAFDVVVRVVEELAPLLVLDRPGRLSFPTRGPSRYFGGDDALARRVLDAVRATGVGAVHVGIADGDLAAGLAARATGSVPERQGDALVVPPGETPAFLAPWSVGVLALHVEDGAELTDLLVRLGLRTLGAFAELPEPAVLARFGVAGVHAHRLARGDAVEGPSPLPVPPELVETMELDPPAVRVDEAAFAAKALADRLLARLADLGLSCSRVVVEAETEHGERMARCWRHDGALTSTTLLARVRWQLEGWLTAQALGRSGSAPVVMPDDVDVVTSGITLVRLVPDDVVPAVGRQLGFWGSDPAATDRAGRALTRVQGMLGADAVVTAVPAGGRMPSERVHWVPWGEARDGAVDRATRDPDAPWPGAVPGPSPARVLDPPAPAELLDAAGEPVTVSGRGEVSGVPAVLRCAALPAGGGAVVAVAGPWPHDVRWWETGAQGPTRRARRRRVVWQLVVGPAGDGPDAVDGQVACLVTVARGRAALEAVYD